jgi:hypothetical protein
VVCSEDGFDVVGVDVSGANLTGTLPVAGSMTSLKVLLLNKNPHLTGTLPAGGCCTRLLELTLWCRTLRTYTMLKHLIDTC